MCWGFYPSACVRSGFTLGCLSKRVMNDAAAAPVCVKDCFEGRQRCARGVVCAAKGQARRGAQVGRHAHTHTHALKERGSPERASQRHEKTEAQSKKRTETAKSRRQRDVAVCRQALGRKSTHPAKGSAHTQRERARKRKRETVHTTQA